MPDMQASDSQRVIRASSALHDGSLSLASRRRTTISGNGAAALGKSRLAFEQRAVRFTQHELAVRLRVS